MLSKLCSKCKRIKFINKFHKNKARKDGLADWCSECKKECYKNKKDKLKRYAKEYYKNNIDKIKEYRKNNRDYFREAYRKYCKNNLLKVKQYKKEYQVKYRKKNIERLRKNYNKYIKNRRKIDMKYQLNHCIRSAINRSLKGNKNGRHWETLVGYTLEDLIIHLEKQFKEGISWDNYGRSGWEIDHIKPISGFKFNSYDDENFKQCWLLENLQPLWKEENLRKGDKKNEFIKKNI